MTPLLTRIDEELARCSDPLWRAELMAERGCYFARVGNFAGANEIIAWLRHAYGDGRYERISVWTMLLEGLVLYFENVSSSSRDRIFRANTLAAAAGMKRLVALTSVWCAHVDFERSAYSQMAEMLSIAIISVQFNEHDVHSRLGLVLGDAYAYSGARADAQYWYEHARRHAIEIGDQATVGAIMYNRPAFALAALRLNHHLAAAQFDRLALRHIEMELRSAQSFQVGTAVTALPHVLEIAKARVAMCIGRFAEALSAFQTINSTLPGSESRGNRSSVVADIALCAHSSGRIEIVRSILESIKPMDIESLDIDDRVIAASILEELTLEYLGAEQAKPYSRIYENAKVACVNEANALKVALAKATERISGMTGRFE